VSEGVTKERVSVSGGGVLRKGKMSKWREERKSLQESGPRQANLPKGKWRLEQAYTGQTNLGPNAVLVQPLPRSFTLTTLLEIAVKDSREKFGIRISIRHIYL